MRVVCHACRRGWHPECAGPPCRCQCNFEHPEELEERVVRDSAFLAFEEMAAENPAYGPGNPDWERDFDREGP